MPNDFCDEACKLFDEFRRKTINEKVEWMLYFDYTTGEVIYCWKGEETKSGGKFNAVNFHGRKIASIHSHSNCYSFPSPNNFDILENEFEDYEIITSVGAIWIVEFKGNTYKSVREEFQFKIGDDINDMIKNIRLYYDIQDVDVMTEKIIDNYLLYQIDDELNDMGLVLTKKELD